ncbi:MAG: hypothetical protein ACAH12_08945 [Methylophilaceae bacterium]
MTTLRPAIYLILMLCMNASYAMAEDSNTTGEDIRLIEIDDADCAVKDGKLIAIQNLNPKETMVVWIDRWFMDKQTADHTKQVLEPNKMPTPLGCSMTNSGKQHWTIFSAAVQP